MMKDLKYLSGGFNLFELVMVMSIIAILATIGIPSFKYVTTANRISSEVNSLLGDMQFAHSEALKEGQYVTVCASSNPTAVTPSCSASTSWLNGWIVFSDPNQNQIVDVGEPILRVQTALNSSDTFVADNSVQAVTFNREGFPASGTIGNTLFLPAVTFTLHDSTANGQWTRCLAVNTTLPNPALPNAVGMLGTEKAGTGNCL